MANSSSSTMLLGEKLKKYRLTENEYERIKSLLKREPLEIEWPLFSALWSEHCSYKSSKNHLKKFSYRNSATPDLSGENAGVVDLGHGEKVIFKMESHNHPSFIEPFQGAATGVGGILRDIFTMGARPMALSHYLCFGDIQAERMPFLLEGVIAGISHYGNCVGVPMLTGSIHFHPSYNKNILANVMAIGILSKANSKMALSGATGVGNFVVYVGAKTGTDGVHGASMASESFDPKKKTAKTQVQIGDPFYEKLLIEACLEVLDQELVIAMQDMGAAGLTSSSFEMSSKGQHGLILDLSQVPLRVASMQPEDILLSESQERMLLICEPDKFQKLQTIFHKWGLDAQVIGSVQKERKIKLLWKNEVLTEIDPDLIVENAPRYERPFNELSSLTKNKVDILPEQKKDYENLTKQFDQRVGGQTIFDCRSTLGFFKLPDTSRGLFLAQGARPWMFVQNTILGALDAYFEPYMKISFKGGRPLAMTDCLNFANPEKRDVMSEFVACVDLFALCAKKGDTPVISGNVSFYNETSDQGILPTPAVGMIGLREDLYAPLDFISSKLFTNLYNEWQQDVGLISFNLFNQFKSRDDIERNLDLIFEFIREVSFELKNFHFHRMIDEKGLEFHLKKFLSFNENDSSFEKKLSEVYSRCLNSVNTSDASWTTEVGHYQIILAGYKNNNSELESSMNKLIAKHKNSFLLNFKDL